VNDLTGENYILVETFSGAVENSPAEYLIRVDFYDIEEVKSTFVPQNGGRIEYDYIRKEAVRLKWSPLSALDPGAGSFGQALDGVRYKLVFSENQNAVLDSVCAIKRASSVYTVYEDIDGDNEYEVDLKSGIAT